MGGVNGKYLISVGTDYLRSYPIESDGAVGKQVSEINTQDYGGSDCGNTTDNGATLDRTGKYMYVQLFTYQSMGNCAAWQSYEIASNGDLTFVGYVEDSGYVDGYATGGSLPAFSSNDDFAYSLIGSYEEGEGYNFSNFASYSRAPGGALEINQNFTEADPVPDPNALPGWNQVAVSADSAGHLAALMFEGYPSNGPDYTVGGPFLLGSYSINSAGGVVSTNTYRDAGARNGWIHGNLPIGQVAGLG
jgi:hypothetical protein